VTELQHSMYGDCQPPFLIVVPIIDPPPLFLHQACYGHTEIHPYDYENIESVSNLRPGDINTESHTAGAPIYTIVVECHPHVVVNPSCQTNILGHLIHSSEHTTWNSYFFIDAPPKPSNCGIHPCRLQFNESNVETVISPPGKFNAPIGSFSSDKL